MTINIRGKEYVTVAERVDLFRKVCPTWSIITRVDEQTDERVTVHAAIVSEDGRTLATGHAEEYRAASSINRTSALENCETSAVGRALAFLGYTGDARSLASADEMRQKAGVPPSLHEQQIEACRKLSRELGATTGDEADAMVRAGSQDALGWSDVARVPGDCLAALRDYRERS